MASVPARSASNMKVMLLVNRIISPICASVREVPMEATTFLTPAWASPRTSVYPSTTTTSSASAIARLAWYSP